MIGPGEKRNNYINDEEEELLDDEQYIQFMVDAFNEADMFLDDDYEETEEDLILKEMGY